VVDLESGEEVQLTEQADNYEPEWSPDGTAIVFGSNRDGNQEIYVMRNEGSHETRLTNSPLIDIAPSWGPA
jgi:Tol biopolymer transport system component